MKVAVVGGGGREHALAYILAKSPIVEKLYALPGSDAMASIAEPVAIGVEDLDGIADFCTTHGIDMVVVGPEVPLTEGLADCCQEKGIAVFGPNKAAAQMEGSKTFAKNLMKNIMFLLPPMLHFRIMMQLLPIFVSRELLSS